MLTISGRAIGARKPLFADWSIPIPPDLDDHGGGLTLRDLIARVVRVEVAAFRGRQEDRRLARAFSARQIEQAALLGKVDMGGREPGQEVDEDQAIAAALQAFEDGIYLVVLDEEEYRDLDRPVYLRTDSRMTFIRLTLLAGG